MTPLQYFCSTLVCYILFTGVKYCSGKIFIVLEIRFCEHYRILTTMLVIAPGSIYNVCSKNVSNSTIKDQI